MFGWGSDDMTDAPSDLSNALLTILLGRSGSSTFDGVVDRQSHRATDRTTMRATLAQHRDDLICAAGLWYGGVREAGRKDGLVHVRALSRQPTTSLSEPRLRMDDELAGRQRLDGLRVEVRQRRSSRRVATRGLSASAAGLDKAMRS